MRRLSSLLVLACINTAPALSADDPAVAAARAYREKHEAEIVNEFADLLAIPNVASDLPNVTRNAEWIRDALNARGVQATLWQIDGVPPIVFGELEAPGATTTLGIYVHYDGQPVVEADWSVPAWRATLHTGELESSPDEIPLPLDATVKLDPEWRLYGRSTGDDKAPIPALLAALDGLAEAGIRPTANLKFFFEGEEEAGSDHLRNYMELYREDLEVDVWLIFDGPVHQSRRPQLVFGVRGYTGLEITTYGASRYLHSGHYGNWSPNPGLRLAQLLASMKDTNGNVVIENFFDDTVEAGAAEREALAKLPPVEAQLRREFGLAEGATDGAGETLAERLLLPSLNIRGLASAAVGPGARNVIPTEATASLDIRLVKGNDPERMLDVVEAHIRSQGFEIVRDEPTEEQRLTHPKIARVVRSGGYRAARTALDHPAAVPVIAAARRAAGENLLLVPSLGGSLPLYLFNEVLERPVVIVPIANHDNNQHAPDENLRMANLWYGIDLMAALLTLDTSALREDSP